MGRAPARILVVILLVGLCLRVACILWGVPVLPYHSSYHPDEPKVCKMTAEFPRVYLTDERFLMYGTVFPYTLGVLLLPLKMIVVALLGRADAYPTIAWIASRVGSVFCGVGTIVLLFVVARRLFDSRTAILSAAFLATSFYHTMNSAIATLDVPMSFLLMVNIVLWLRACERPGRFAYGLLGVASGLLMGTKITGGLLLVVVLIIGVVSRFGEASARAPLSKRVEPRRSFPVTYLLGALVTFAIFHPHVFLHPERYLEVYLSSKVDWIDRKWVMPVEAITRVVSSTLTAVGAPVALLAIPGAAMVPPRLRGVHAGLLLFIGLYYGIWRWFFPARYAIPIAPILCLFAARTCSAGIDQRSAVVKWTGCALAGVTIGYSLYLCIAGIAIRFSDTRPAAARYLAHSVPPGTTVALSTVSESYPWRHHAWHYPVVDFSMVRETSLLEEPELVVTSSYDLARIEEALQSDKLLPGYQWDPAWNRAWYRYSPPTPRLFQFYEQLLASSGAYALVKTFKTPVPVPIEFPPPEIRIYQRRAASRVTRIAPTP